VRQWAAKGIDADRGAVLMDRIECEWCKEQNPPDRTDCINCGAPLNVKDRVSDPRSNQDTPASLDDVINLAFRVASQSPDVSQARVVSFRVGSQPPLVSQAPFVSQPPVPARSKRGWGIGIAVAVVVALALALAAGIIALIIHLRPTGPTRLQTADGLSSLLGQIHSRFGDTMGYQLMVYSDYAVLDRADPQHDRHKQSYTYRGGKWTTFGKSTTISSFDNLVDLSKFNTTAVIATLKGAPESLDITDPKDTDLIVKGAKDGSLSLTIDVSDGDRGSMDINPDGSVKALHPPS
jgi:hypothetical protein